MNRIAELTNNLTTAVLKNRKLEAQNADLLEVLGKIARFGVNQERPSSDLLLVQAWANEAIRKAKEKE